MFCMCILFAPMYRFTRLIAFALLLVPAFQSNAQTKFRLGLTGGGTICRNSPADTGWAKNYSRRNKIGVSLGIAGQYDLRKMVTIHFGVSYVGKGYKINNDTLGTNPSVTRRINTINVPIGISFKQNFNSSNFILEKFGFAGSFDLGKATTTTNNNNSVTTFRVVEKRINPIYPMFFLGIGMGGTAENGDRYEFGLTYYQSFSKNADLSVQHGTNLAKSFPLTYRGGFLNIGFSYYFNLTNFKRTSDYFE